MNANPNTEANFQGRWVDIGVVTDLGTTEETIEWLDHVYADTSISKDSDSDEFQYNGSQYTITEEGHVTREAEFGIYPDSENADLQTLGLVDGDGAELHNVRQEAVVFVIWPSADETDDTTAIKRVGENVRVQTGEESLSDGPYEFTFTLFIEGKYWFDGAAALNDGS
ncbi:hypothetical protein JMJ58_14880 [Haloterrigena salifodinae]|uniref:Uncharacterized protein n=1 Tax=Haloterrigena salifodinae TaxID=2675099 RepID=A0A8T8DXA3_9EURY|nr:hypothetical protein [Haloterrigena salifodinae]QRV14218.1 hypothetical protein JMJ58_14880 [Haloterrigena salifodinae]